MMSVVLIIIAVLFSILGIYYLSEIVIANLFETKSKKYLIIVPANCDNDTLLNDIYSLQTKNKNGQIIVLCSSESPTCQSLQSSWKNVIFTNCETISSVIAHELDTKSLNKMPQCQNGENTN